MRFLVLSVLVMVLAPVASFAQPNLSGAIGEYGAETGTKGAVTNRRLADELYKQSLEDEKNAWRRFPPNVRLLSRALANSKDAKTADDQAKEFARAALHGLGSGSLTGDFQTSQHGIVSPEELKNLSEKSSAYRPEVERTLNSYSGMKLDADKMVLKTPFGDVSVDVSRETMEKVMRGAATVLGYDANEVSEGIRDAERMRNEMAARVSQQVAAELAAKKAALAAAGGASKEGQTNGPGQAAGGAPGEGEGGDRAPASEDPNAGVIAATEPDWDERRRAFQQHQDAMKRQLGLGMKVQSTSGEPLGHKADNLFDMIHRKYQAMRGTGAFIETLETAQRNTARAK